MPDQPKMLAWAVALQFEGGRMVVNCVLAQASEMAAATVAVQAVQQLGITEPLERLSFVPVEERWLDLAVKATKGQLPEGGAQVLSLVPKPEPQAVRPETNDQVLAPGINPNDAQPVSSNPGPNLGPNPFGPFGPNPFGPNPFGPNFPPVA